MPGDLVHVEVGLDDLRDVEHGLVADAGEKRERQRALAHRHVDAEVAALQHHRRRRAPAGSCGYGTGQRLTPADEVDDAVAVRAEHGQVAGGLAQRLLAGDALGRARLGEARPRRERRRRRRARQAAGRSRCSRRRSTATKPRPAPRGGRAPTLVRGVPADLGTGGMDGVDRPVEAGRLALGKGVRRERAADERDAPRPQQPADVLRGGGHPAQDGPRRSGRGGSRTCPPRSARPARHASSARSGARSRAPCRRRSGRRRRRRGPASRRRRASRPRRRAARASPWSSFHDACRVSSQAARISVSMSASLNETPWNSPIGRPNWRRVRAQSAASSSTSRARPVQCAAIITRLAYSHSVAKSKPFPSAPRMPVVRHAHVRERDQVGVVAARRDAADRRHLDPRQILVDEERREARTRALRRLVLAGDGDEDDVVGVIGVRDELLRPVDDPVASRRAPPASGSSARRSRRPARSARSTRSARRGSSAGGSAPAAPPRRRAGCASADATHELSAQLVRAELHLGQRRGDVVEAAAAELLRHVERIEAGRDRLGLEGARELPRDVRRAARPPPRAGAAHARRMSRTVSHDELLLLGRARSRSSAAEDGLASLRDGGQRLAVILGESACLAGGRAPPRAARQAFGDGPSRAGAWRGRSRPSGRRPARARAPHLARPAAPAARPR